MAISSNVMHAYNGKSTNAAFSLIQFKASILMPGEPSINVYHALSVLGCGRHLWNTFLT